MSALNIKQIGGSSELTYGDSVRLSVSDLSVNAGNLLVGMHAKSNDELVYECVSDDGKKTRIASPSSFAPPRAGAFTIIASSKETGETVAASQVNIAKRQLVVTPKWTAKTPVKTSGIKATSVSGLQKGDSLSNAFKVRSSLYRSNGVIKTTSFNMSRISLLYSTKRAGSASAIEDLQSKYDIRIASKPLRGASGTVIAKAKAKGKRSLKVSWKKVSGAQKYRVYLRYGTKGKLKLKKTVSSSKRSVIIKKLKKHRLYTVQVRACATAGKKTSDFARSLKLYAATGKYCKRGANTKKVKTSARSVTFKVGKSKRVKAKCTSSVKKKKALKVAKRVRYVSSDTSIAKVSASGKITAKRVGKCTVYAVANNGVYKTVKVRVKK